MTSALTGRRLLLIENDYLFAGNLAEALSANGAVIGPAASVDAALDCWTTTTNLTAPSWTLTSTGKWPPPSPMGAQHTIRPLDRLRPFSDSPLATPGHGRKAVDADGNRAGTVWLRTGSTAQKRYKLLRWVTKNVSAASRTCLLRLQKR